MKLFKYISALALIGALAACAPDDVQMPAVSETNYGTSSDAIAMLTDTWGTPLVTNVQFRDSGAINVKVALTKPLSSDAAFTLTYDAAALDAFNAAHGTSYQALPQELTGIPTAITVKGGALHSDSCMVTYITSPALDSLATYAIPLSIKSNNAVRVSDTTGSLIVLAKDISRAPDCAKSTGIRIVSCMDISHTNPLNHTLFTLKESGKPFFDMVILFSSNIRIDPVTGRVGIYHSPGASQALNNYMTYLKPLQDMGMKIVLSILPKGDGVGLCNLSDEGYRYLAQQISNTLDAYHLDGVFFDEEYANYSGHPLTGQDFVPYTAGTAKERAARLIFETKKAIKDKLTIVYAYSTLSSLPAIDEVPSGEYVDMAINDYLVSTDRSKSFPGMDKMNMGIYSQECALNKYATATQLRSLRSKGFGLMMFFDMNPFNLSSGVSNFASKQIPALERTCQYLFDETLVYPDASGDNYKVNYYKSNW